MLDGMFVLKKRVTKRCEPVLEVLGITDAGQKHVLDVMPAPGETSEAWQTCLQRVEGKGLNVGKVRMVISDGCKGIINAIGTELPQVPRQRCST